MKEAGWKIERHDRVLYLFDQNGHRVATTGLMCLEQDLRITLTGWADKYGLGEDWVKNNWSLANGWRVRLLDGTL